MAHLSYNWITENLIDFEYKKYVLLGYLQHVEKHFKEQKLYPHLAELIEHYKAVVNIKENTISLENSFKKKLKGIDPANMKLVYESLYDNDTLNELKQIIEFSEPLLNNELQKGKQIFDYAEKHICAEHVGIMPIYKQEGYFVLLPYQSNKGTVYNYALSKINHANQDVYGLQTNYITNYNVTITQTIDGLKGEMISANPNLPNPAVYLFRANAPLPKEETFLPIAKRLLYKKILTS